MPQGKISANNTMMSFTIPKSLKDKIGKIANKENRSMSNLIVNLLEDYSYLSESPDRLERYRNLLIKLKAEDTIKELSDD